MALHRIALALLASWLAASTVAATGILLPLYAHPPANWRPALDAMAASAHVPWLVVVNPDDGPGTTTTTTTPAPDADYAAGVARLNALENVRTLGYVRVDYGAAAAAELRDNVTAWAAWAGYRGGGEYSDADAEVEVDVDVGVGVDGIFFDAASAAAKDFDALSAAVLHARRAFGTKQIVTVCNFGTAAAVEFYGICDVVVVFEGALNSPDFPAYEGRATINAHTPAWDGGYEAQAAVLVHHFVGAAEDGRDADAALLGSYVREARDADLGWVYFCSGDYDSVTTAPATIGALAAVF